MSSLILLNTRVVKVKSGELNLFLFLFDLFSIFLSRIRVRVTRSYCHTSVTSDDTVTVIVTSHEMHRRK